MSYCTINATSGGNILAKIDEPKEGLLGKASQSQASRWLEENGPKELELLFRAIVYHPAAPSSSRITIANTVMPVRAPASCWDFPGIRSSAAGWMTLRHPASSRKFRSY